MIWKFPGPPAPFLWKAVLILCGGLLICAPCPTALGLPVQSSVLQMRVGVDFLLLVLFCTQSEGAAFKLSQVLSKR